MGKDKTKGCHKNAATSSNARVWEQESRDTALARTIAQAVAEAFAKQKPMKPNLSQKLSQGRWRRLRCNMRSF